MRPAQKNMVLKGDSTSEETAGINCVVYCDPRGPVTAYDHKKESEKEKGKEQKEENT